MPTQPSLNLLPTVQQAISNLLLTYEPEFIRFGYQLFLAFATIVIAWHGIRMMLSGNGLGDQTFDFAKLRESVKSDTLQHQNLTVQMTSQPAWYAVMALPYLMEYPHECTEQTFNRLYANSLARHVAASDPKIRKVFDQWRDTPALDSPLFKNQDLKAAMIEETPDLVWMFDSDGLIEYTSPSFSAALGLRQDEVIGRLWRALTHPLDVQVLRQALADAGPEEPRTPIIEVRLRASNGGWVWVEGQATLRFRGNSAIAVEITGRDVSRTRAAEDEGRRLSSQLEALVAGAPYGILMIDEFERIAVINGGRIVAHGLESREAT